MESFTLLVTADETCQLVSHEFFFVWHQGGEIIHEMHGEGWKCFILGCLKAKRECLYQTAQWEAVSMFQRAQWGRDMKDTLKGFIVLSQFTVLESWGVSAGLFSSLARCVCVSIRWLQRTEWKNMEVIFKTHTPSLVFTFFCGNVCVFAKVYLWSFLNIATERFKGTVPHCWPKLIV